MVAKVSFRLSQGTFPTVQEVLQADWHEVAQSVQVRFSSVSSHLFATSLKCFSWAFSIEFILLDQLQYMLTCRLSVTVTSVFYLRLHIPSGFEARANFPRIPPCFQTG
jgi:hypothetical protein